MFCNKCGNKIEDGQPSCINCGEPIGANPQLQELQNEHNKSNPKKSIIKKLIPIIAIVLCLALLFGGLNFFGILETPQAVVRKYQNAVFKGNLNDSFKYMAYDREYHFKTIAEESEQTANGFKEQYGTTDYKKVMKKAEEAYKKAFKNYLEEEYGKNIKFKVKITGVNYLSKSEMDKKIKQLKEGLSYLELSFKQENIDFDMQRYLPTNKIKKMCTVKVKTIISGSKKNGIEDDEIYCAKINGKWKILESTTGL